MEARFELGGGQDKAGVPARETDGVVDVRRPVGGAFSMFTLFFASFALSRISGLTFAQPIRCGIIVFSGLPCITPDFKAV
jgi:hypothetical protein